MDTTEQQKNMNEMTELYFIWPAKKTVEKTMQDAPNYFSDNLELAIAIF